MLVALAVMFIVIPPIQASYELELAVELLQLVEYHHVVSVFVIDVSFIVDVH